MDEAGDLLVGPAVELVRRWLQDAERSLTGAERRTSDRLHRLTGDPRSVAFTMAFCDRVLRPDDDRTAAEQLRSVATAPLPSFLGATDRLLLRLGSWLSRPVPGIVMPLARRRLRRIVGGLVVDNTDAELGCHLRALAYDGFDVNANLLGELVLGEGEAARRAQATMALLARDDVDYVSVKASSLASQINLWAYDTEVGRVAANLRPLLAAAAASTPPKLVNLDMEEYRDLHLTIDAFTRLLEEPALRGVEAGIVLQAYLPDSFDALQELVVWAQRRRAGGGAGIKVRIVKGANLAMERVDAAMHGWVQAPYATKAETDASYKRMVDWALQPDRVDAARVGVASHNLFDLAWAMLLAEHRGVTDRVECEMLQGMAPGVARTVRAATGRLLLYTPVVDAADFDTALAYLFRRLEENSSGENFLRHLFDLAGDPDQLAVEQGRFERAVSDRWTVASTPRRRQPVTVAGRGFRNEPDSDPTDPDTRARMVAALAAPPELALPAEATQVAEVDAAVGSARRGAIGWDRLGPSARQEILRRVADELSSRRPQLLATMADEAGKTIGEGDAEVGEAIDFARYYAERIPELVGDAAAFRPFGVVAVVPPWNFPLAIPAGGVLAALAAGNAVVLKPAPQTPRTAFALAEACWAGGVPRDALRYLRCPDGPIGEHVIAHEGIDAIVLTGAYDTARLFHGLAPATPLFAETSGKNAIVVLPDADLDLAVADLVRSAFGHAGQKCSAASLAICVGEVATSVRFRRQLVDATRTLVVGDARRPETVMGPLIEAPSDKLRRALTTLEPGQRWLLEPRPLDAATLWSPGILDGVARGSWFHQTECFGPVLGLMAAPDLDAAIALQNGVPFGLTGGIHTLDPAKAAHWLDRVEVGNAYVNRPITGAIVQRQPFGGWKRSVVGPGAKAGGPNYVAQLGHWTTTGLPQRGRSPSPAVQARLRALVEELEGLGGLDPADRARLDAAARSDALAWDEELAVEHDPTGLFCEANVL
ncbi:MAG TPA: bifunctional proline dehydrogenase/L-glutamate gamma-semialdehyde dehydrogenase, partial [Acidimicrobiales bacterium]|nr:bifunctional proline dehydrogenase/L-glutamate gamma-semialdehyde dehydrogenase [Acidimicrobiales bacterium]